MPYSSDDAMRIAQDIARQARQWAQVEIPSSTDKPWICNACPFETTNVQEAERHALMGGHVHILWSARGSSKRGRRMHSPDGQEIKVEERLKAAR